MQVMSCAPEWVSNLIRQALERQRQATDSHAALALSEWLATFLWKNPTGIYRLDELETGLLVHCPPLQLPAADHEPTDETELHVATEVYAFGGHTSLMRQLIHAGPDSARALLTGMLDPAIAATRLGLPLNRLQVLEPSADRWQRIGRLAQTMSRHRKVILHIHPNDLVAALAVRWLKQHAPHTRVLFVNHADHAFSVGIGAADRVLEISRYGWSLRGRRGTELRSTFMGIPIAQPASTPRSAHGIDTDSEPAGNVTLLSGGSAYKYKPVEGMSLPSAFGKLLRQHPEFKVTVIGPSKRDWWWWWLRCSQPTRFRLTPLMPKDAYMSQLRTCTIYVDSHPLLGGTAFPEALMRGCRIAGIRGLAWGYSPADELCSASEDGFLRQCDALAQSEPEALAYQEQVREKCIMSHDPQRVRSRLTHALLNDELLPAPPSPIPEPSADATERAWRRKDEVSLPSRKECPLGKADRHWLARVFAQRKGGLWHRSTWTLLRLAFTTHR